MVSRIATGLFARFARRVCASHWGVLGHLALGIAALPALAQSTPPAPTAGDLLPASFIPKSPTVAALQRFDNQQLVHLPTGAAQLSIPLAEISRGSLRLPVSLSYSYTGLQVGQPYELVGLGWSLQAGSSITRQVNGVADELYRNNPDARYHPDSVWAGSGTQRYLKRAFQSAVDTGPDLYSFSLPDGSSGRFMLLDTAVVLFPQQPIHIRRLHSLAGGFQITTEAGVRYQFQAAETTRPNPNNFGLIGEHTTAWQLTRLISTDCADTLSLHYNTHSGFEDLPQQSSVTTGSYYTGTFQENGNATGDNGPGTACGSEADYPFHNAWMYPSKVQAQYLDSITSRESHLTFTRNDRHELQQVRLVALGQGRREIRRIQLYQYHFPGELPTGDYHLRLDSLRESAQGLALPAYRFRYLEGTPMPARGSAAKDYWGYFNGASRNGDFTTRTNPSLLADPRLNQGQRQAADREPHHLYAQAGALLEVRYPTGGTTHWAYEPGRLAAELADVPVSYLLEEISTRYDATTAQVPEGGAANRLITTSDELLFQVPQKGAVDVVLTRERYSENTTGGTNTYRDFNVWRRLPTGDSLVTTLADSHYKVLDSEQTEERAYVFSLSPGTYVARVYCERYEAGTRLSLRIPYRDSSLVKLGLPGPGIRVRQTTTTAPGTPPLVRSYHYTANGYCSGTSLLPEAGKGFSKHLFTKTTEFNNKTILISTTCEFMSTSSDNRGLGNEFNKYDFYYTCVREETGPANGAAVTYYTHLAHQFNDVVPLLQLTYRQDAQRTQRQQLATYTRYVYAEDNLLLYPLLRVREKATYSGNNTVVLGTQYEADVYDVQAGFAAPLLTEQIRYDEQGRGQTTLTRSSYQQQRLVGTATRTSTGWQIQRYKRLSDYAPSPAVTALRVHHFNPVVETQLWRRPLGAADSTLLGGQLTFFEPGRRQPAGHWSLHLSRPVSAPNAERRINGAYVGFKSDTRYRPQDSVRYDPATGLLQERQPPHGPCTTYLWGYGRTEVIAQIEQATYAQVVAVLGQATLTQLQDATPRDEALVRQYLHRLRTHLPQARVSTYTHQPLVGVTSQTGPDGRTVFYEYDQLGRLQRVRDEQGRVLSENEYHYARPSRL